MCIQPAETSLSATHSPYIVMAAAPTITTQPQNQRVTSGLAATFSVTSASNDGGTLSYQWQSKALGASGFTPITGATSDSYATPMLTTSDSGIQYRCVVTSTLEGTTASTNSNAVTLTVDPAHKPGGGGGKDTSAAGSSAGTPKTENNRLREHSNCHNNNDSHHRQQR